MEWVWTFLIYGFLGFLLEEGFAGATGGRMDRKALRVLPLCPVYGLGAGAILLLGPPAASWPPLLFLVGAAAATAVEYFTAIFYERAFGVTFWDYRGLPWNLQGKVCLPFSLAWGVLSLPLVLWLHPRLVPWLSVIPAPVTWLALATLAADMVLTGVLLRRTGDRSRLRWRQKMV